MGEPIEPPEGGGDCCPVSYAGQVVGPNSSGWPFGNCGPIEEQWAWLALHHGYYTVILSNQPPPCMTWCIYKMTAILDCFCDGFTVGMWIWNEFLGMSDNADERFGAYEVMIRQNFAPFDGLLNEQVLLNDEEWFGVRDGTRNVKILVKRDLTVPPP